MKKLILTSFPISTNENLNIKIPGIKAIRGLLDIGLKEAKSLIEQLMEKQQYTVNVNLTNEKNNYLKTFTQYGGQYIIDDDLESYISKATQIALNDKQYKIAHVLINLLKEMSDE